MAAGDGGLGATVITLSGRQAVGVFVGTFVLVAGACVIASSIRYAPDGGMGHGPATPADWAADLGVSTLWMVAGTTWLLVRWPPRWSGALRAAGGALAVVGCSTGAWTLLMGSP